MCPYSCIHERPVDYVFVETPTLITASNISEIESYIQHYMDRV